MPPVYVTTQDPGETFELIRDRTFEHYGRDHNFGSGVRLVDILLEKAQQKPAVYFYDIGCGEGGVVTDMFQAVAKRAKERNLPRSLTNRIRYIGIDAHVGDHWIDSERTKFYEGDLITILNSGSLPPADVAVANEVFPYLDHKLEAVEAAANHLNREGGILSIKPFKRHQLRYVNDSTIVVDMADAFGKDIEVVNYDTDSLVLRPNGEGKRIQLRLAFSHADFDFWQYMKGHIIGDPGQKISYYKQAGSSRRLLN